MDIDLQLKVSELQHCLNKKAEISQEAQVVLVTGVFDVLHQEHFKFLKKAKQLGDYLIVGIESDARVKKLKGAKRPINSQNIRQANLEMIESVDCVFILPENIGQKKAQEELISKIQPDYLAVSSNTPHSKKKEQIMKDFKGRVVVVHEHNPKISTTKIIQERGLL